jgi:protein-disulfide isomerase
MPSGKQAKAARRAARTAPPPVQSKGSPRRPRQASPRTLAIGGGVLIVIVVAIVLAAVLGGGGSGTSASSIPTTGSIGSGLPGAADVNAMFKGIPQKGLTLGSPFAPVTLVEYIDLQCPFCQQFETQVFPSLVRRYVRTGKLKVIARPVAFIGTDSQRGRNAMIAAGQQGKGFNFAEILYDNQRTENTGWLNDSMVAQAAESIPGLNPRLVYTARNSAAVKKQAGDYDALQSADQVNQTPTLFVGKSGTKGKVVNITSPTDEASVVKAIKAALPS